MEETKHSSEFKKSKSKDSHDEIGKEEDNEEEVELTEKEWHLIHHKIKKHLPYIEKSLQDVPVNVKGVYISVIVSLLFIVLASYINRVEDVANMASSIQDQYENSYWDDNTQSKFASIAQLSDVSLYIKHVVIPSALGTIGNYNYFVGLRMTLKKSKVIKNDNFRTANVTEYVKLTPSIQPVSFDGYDDPKMNGLWEYSEGFEGDKGFVIVYLASSSEETILEDWREAEKIWLDEREFGTLAIDFIYHNPNFECTLYYYQTFELHPSGVVYPKSEVLGSFIEKFEKIENDSLVVFVLFIVYSLGFSLQIFKLAQNLMRTCKTIMVKRKLDLVWHEYIEIFSVVLALTSLILFGTAVFAQIGKFSLPVTNESDFAAMANYNLNFRVLIQITALAALLIAFKVIVVLRYKFPSFGVLFDTILHAKTDIINFIVITIFLLIGFVFWGTLVFGIQMEVFSTTILSFRLLFDMALGQEKFKDPMKQVNQIISFIFLIGFLTCFFLVLLNTFLAIVMSTYEDLKHKGQLILEAKAEMIAEQSEEWFQALTNLVFFRVVSVENDAIEYEELHEMNKDGLSEKEKQDIDEKMKMYETLIIASTKVDIIKIFKTNFGKLSSLNKPTLLTHEQNIHRIQKTLEKILERALLNKKRNEHQQRLVDYNFNLVVQMLIYLVFIVVFIVMILLRLHTFSSYGIHELNHESFVNTQFGNGFTLGDANTQDMVFQYLHEVFVPQISGDSLFKQNFFLENTRARITMQFYILNSNTNSFSSKIAPEIVLKEQTNIMQESFRGNNSKILYEYYPPGTKESFNQEGGFVSYLSTDTDMDSHLNILQLDDVLGISGYYLAVEWVTYNANLNLFGYSYIKFTHDISGIITHEFYCLPIELDYFKDSNPVRGILEILYFLFTIYYLILEIREWLEVWQEVRTEVREKQKGSDALYRVCIRLLGSDKVEKGCGNMMRIAMIKAKSALGWFITIVFNVMQTMKRYFKKDAFNIIDTISIILSFMTLSQILQLALNDFMKNFTIENASSYDYIGEFSAINSILISYKQIVAFNCLIVFVRLLQFYKFSKRLSLLTDILDSATLDLIFYMVMFAIILFAYTLMGYLLLGHTLPYFSTLPWSLISCYLMLTNTHTSSEIYNADPIFGTLFYVSFIIMFGLIMLNMFIAIIGSHFEKIVEEEDPEEDEVGFLSKIISVFRAKRQGKKYLGKEEKTEESENVKHGENADIGKKIEEEMFRVENCMPDPCNSAYWMKVIESVLSEKSDQKVNLFALKMMSSSKEKKQKITAVAKLAEIAFVSLEYWRQSDFSEKLRIWRTLVMLSREFAVRSIEKAFIEGAEVPDGVKLFGILEKIWNENEQEEKLQLWMGNEHFDSVERVAVWNFLKFDNQTFGIDPDADFEEVWTDYSLEKRLEVMNWIINRNQNEIKSIKKSPSAVSTISNIADNISDFKFVLWLGLIQNSQWLKSLYVNQPNSFQAEIIAMLNLGLYCDNIFALEGMDVGLEDLLDGMIYDFVEAKANYMSELQKLLNTKNQVISSLKDIESLKDYHEYAKQEVEKLRKKKRELEMEYKRFKKN